jgi:hypothetical protein
LSGNGFRKGLEQALHVLQLRPSFIQPVSSQRRQTGSLRGGGAAVLATATCLLVSSLSRFPIAVVSSMIDPFIFFLLCGLLGQFLLPLVAVFVEPIINDTLKLSLAVSRFCFLDSHGHASSRACFARSVRSFDLDARAHEARYRSRKLKSRTGLSSSVAYQVSFAEQDKSDTRLSLLKWAQKWA